MVSSVKNSFNKPAKNYFADIKNLEVIQLGSLLRKHLADRHPEEKREIMRSIIKYMSLGYDMSQLFPDIVLATGMNDIVTKKMCYFYLSNYAAYKEELATLCINTLTKDFQDCDPSIRGLALRYISNLRLKSTIEYWVPILLTAVKDPSSYVRQNAVISVLKLYHIDENQVENLGLKDTVCQMIYDVDPQVSSTSIMVLSEITFKEGGIKPEKKLIVHMLSRMNEYCDWGKCIALDILVRYTPSSKSEIFIIMNIMDSFLRLFNSAIVLATVKCFLRYADLLPNLKKTIYLRIKRPLLTIMVNTSHHIYFTILKHIDLMIDSSSGIFDDQYKLFYCLYTEPSYIKLVKLSILPKLVNNQNIHEIVMEFVDYLNIADFEITKCAVEAFGQIAIKLPECSEGLLNQLINYLSISDEIVCVQVIIVIKNLLRKFPNSCKDISLIIPQCMRFLDDPRCKSHVLFILGEFCHNLNQTPYILEAIVDSYEKENSSEVKEELLITVLKLFFRRPGETQGILVQLLTAMINDKNDLDLHLRSLFYYRLLRHNVEQLKDYVLINNHKSLLFTEELNTNTSQKQFNQFNSLSVVYNKLEDEFIDEAYRFPSFNPSIDFVQTKINVEECNSKYDSLSLPSQMNDLSLNSSVLKDINEVLVSDNESIKQKIPWTLDENVIITQECFQELWKSLEVTGSFEIRLSSVPELDEVEELAKKSCIYCMASGDLGDHLQIYFFGRDNYSAIHLASVEIQKVTQFMKTFVKSQDPAESQTFADTLMASVSFLF